MNIEGILQSLDMPSNEHLLQFTSQKIRELNHRVLQQLGMGKEETEALMERLHDYKYIDEWNELKFGAYVRWIPLENPEDVRLMNGAIFCDLSLTDKGNYCVLRSMGRFARHFRISLDSCLLFQKLTPQEQLILSALDHLATTSA